MKARSAVRHGSRTAGRAASARPGTGSALALCAEGAEPRGSGPRANRTRRRRPAGAAGPTEDACRKAIRVGSRRGSPAAGRRAMMLRRNWAPFHRPSSRSRPVAVPPARQARTEAECLRCMRAAGAETGGLVSRDRSARFFRSHGAGPRSAAGEADGKTARTTRKTNAGRDASSSVVPPASARWCSLPSALLTGTLERMGVAAGAVAVDRRTPSCPGGSSGRRPGRGPWSISCRAAAFCAVVRWPTAKWTACGSS